MVELYSKQFLEEEIGEPCFETAKAVILPFPYEDGVSYGRGAAKAPDAVIEASSLLEGYDEILKIEPYLMGIATISPPDIANNKENVFESAYIATKKLLSYDKFVVMIGGDHSISAGFVKALHEKYKQLSVIQLDAHTDLRQSYKGSIFNHACAMSRIREITPDTLQIGIRNMSKKEADRIIDEKLKVFTMSEYRKNFNEVENEILKLPDPVFLTIDVDVFDWSVISSTGTPDPGGFLWDEAIDLFQKIFSKKNIVGFDVVELSYSPNDINSPTAVAKLTYKLLGFQYIKNLNNNVFNSRL